MRRLVQAVRQRRQLVTMQQLGHVVRQHVQVVQNIVRRALVHVRLYQQVIIRPVVTAVAMHVQVKQSVPRGRIVAVVCQITVLREHMVRRLV